MAELGEQLVQVRVQVRQPGRCRCGRGRKLDALGDQAEALEAAFAGHVVAQFDELEVAARELGTAGGAQLLGQQQARDDADGVDFPAGFAGDAFAEAAEQHDGFGRGVRVGGQHHPGAPGAVAGGGRELCEFFGFLDRGDRALDWGITDTAAYQERRAGRVRCLIHRGSRCRLVQ
ncbi:hypothetical protein [Amycolatopsis sp. cg9]|uniref:hypothetical protein n=1 Tax=Amycolatopsis sp. cg9 TaxID=3238801 RepID=UPI003525C86C